MAKFEDIIQGNTLVFVDFFATWCGPCKMMHPILEGLKKQLGERVKIVKIDIDSPVNRQLVNSYQVQAVPTLMLFKAGKMVWRQSGAMQATQIRQVIEKYL
ncbi:MAG: thioredoxin [Odoribacter splanchnicus]